MRAIFFFGFAVNEGVGSQQRNNYGIKTTIAVQIGFIGVDQRLGIGQRLVASQEESEGMTNDRLADFVGFREAVDEIKGILDVAVQLGVIRSLQNAAGIDRQGLILRQRSTKLIEYLAIGFFDEILGMLEIFLKTEASKSS